MISKYLIAPISFLFACISLASEPSPRLLGAHLQTFRAEDLTSFSVADTVVEPTGNLTLFQAQTLALMHNPKLRASAWGIRTAEARWIQSKAYPNPELSLDLENGPGTGEMRNFDNAEQTLQISQLLELGGKTRKRAIISRYDQNQAGWDYETIRLDLITEVTKRFFELLTAQERVELAIENERIAENVLAIAIKRVQSGIAPTDEQIKAQLTVSLSQTEKVRTQNNLASAKMRLTSTWGSKVLRFEAVQNGFDSLVVIPSYERLLTYLQENPDVARWNTELERRHAILTLEKASKTPDLTLSAGVRRFNGNGDAAFVMSASIPIPLLNTNHGNIQAAYFDLIQAREEQAIATSQTTSSLSDVYHNLSIAYSEALKLKNEVLPRAQQVLEIAGEKYRLGNTSYLEVLDAERTVFELRGRYIEVLEFYHISRAEIERLVCTSLSDIISTQENK